MTEWDRLRRRAQMIKDRYPAGTRIMLLHMGNDPNPIAPNTRGTVVAVDDIGTVHCDFDNGRSLGIVPPCRCEVTMENTVIEIPTQLVEPLLEYAAETGLSVEEVVNSAIKNHLERMSKNA